VEPKPHFYDLNNGRYNADEHLFMPFTPRWTSSSAATAT
jgi:hypothetical protein